MIIVEETTETARRPASLGPGADRGCAGGCSGSDVAARDAATPPLGHDHGPPVTARVPGRPAPVPVTEPADELAPVRSQLEVQVQTVGPDNGQIRGFEAFLP